MSNVINLFPEVADDYEGLRCGKCGCAWFSPERVVFNRDGSVTGYSLPAPCASCGFEGVMPS